MMGEAGRGTLFVGVDVGGTNIKAGVVDATGRSLSRVSAPTVPEHGPMAGVETIGALVRRAVSEAHVPFAEIQGVGLATPGTMDVAAGMLIDPPNLPGWDNFPIEARVAENLGKPTILVNDANAAAFGEYWAGAARDARSLVFWTLGTGVGCGIIVNDMIIEGANSHGGECGHIIIEMHNGRRCDTGQYGTLEAYAGAKGLMRRFEEAIAAGETSSAASFLETGESLSPLHLAKAAKNGDLLANRLILETARFLGVGTTTLMHTIDPQMVLIGGAMTFGGAGDALGDLFLAEIRAEVQRRAFPTLSDRTRIDFASLGSDAGTIGAAGWASKKFS